MVSFSALVVLDKSAKSPVFVQIATALAEHIRRGVLLPQTQLPGTRALATALGVHRKTVVAAYDELLAQGWIETQASRGTFVSPKLPEVQPQVLEKSATAPPTRTPGFDFQTRPLLAVPVLQGSDALAFDDGFPDVRLAPWDAYCRAYRSVVRKGFRKKLLFYGQMNGEHSLRAAMTDYLRESRGLPIDVDNVLISRGSMMAIYLVAQCVLRPGDTVLVGDICYTSGNLIFKNAGANLQTVPVDARGLDVDAIEALCQKMPVRMVYVTPHHHYPTTVMMPAERRLRLLQLARTYRFCILEDDYDYDFHYDSSPILPLAGADAGQNVVYIGSLSKVFSPALRVGYVVAPADVIEELARLRRIVDRQGDNLSEAALALLFREGEMRRHLKKAQKVYHRRRNLFCELLKSELGPVVEFSRPSGGLAVWARFDPDLPLGKLAPTAAENGLRFSDSAKYSTHLNATRLGFASVNESEIEQGMAILKKSISRYR